MKNRILISACFILFFLSAEAQIGTGFLYSNVHPNLAINYNSAHTFWGEARFSMDVESSNFSPELIGAYNFISSKEVDLYGGLGGRFNLIPGVVLASGLNAFPFETKNFGFTFETAVLFDVGDDRQIFRGSFGFRYLFND